MRILVIGSGGREHAILWALNKTSGRPVELYCAPGNAGIAEIAQCVSVLPTDIARLADFAASHAIDLTFVGPEAPLALGIVDEFERSGLTIVGPSSSAARLEASKGFAKDFMRRHGVPTAKYRIVASADEALEMLARGDFGGSETPIVVKADGLAAGKGVIIAESRQVAEAAVRSLTDGSIVDSLAAEKIVLEEMLVGTEASLLAFCDGRNYALMPAARDHKRIGDGDTGANTGGMGAITDESVLSQSMLSRITREIVEPTLAGASFEGFPFRGVLFIGLMITADGPKVLEYNVRFGDPETQAILVRLQTDLADIFESMARGRLSEMDVQWSAQSSACVVLASAGYPGKYAAGARISGLERAIDNVEVFHAGTARSQTGEWLTAGGRVLGVTATGNNLGEALDRSYRRVQMIHWEGVQYRRDIGTFRQLA